jgi:hypothetical protein
MPTKEQLEEINDELLAENARLYRTTEQVREMFGELKELIESRVQAPAAAATLATQPPLKEKPSPEQIAQKVSAETMQQFAPVVARMGEVIKTMELAHDRAELKIDQAQIQLNRLDEISRLVWDVRQETQGLQTAARLTKESFWDMLEARGMRVLLTVIISLLIGVLIAAYVFRQVTAPDTLTLEASENWQIYTYDMTPEQKAQLMAEIRAKREKIVAEQDSSQPSAGEQQTNTNGQTTSAGSPPASAQPAQPQSGKGSRAPRH